MKNILALAIAVTLAAGCARSEKMTVQLSDGTTVETIYTSGQDLTVAAGSVSQFRCSPSTGLKDSGNGECVHIGTGGGITNGGAGIVGPALQAAGMVGAAKVAPSSDITVASASGASSNSKSNAKSIGPGSSSIKFDATVKGVNMNSNAANAGAAAVQKKH